MIDRNRRAGRLSGNYLLLGSASLDLLKQSGETLAGRIAYLELTLFPAQFAAIWAWMAKPRLLTSICWPTSCWCVACLAARRKAFRAISTRAVAVQKSTCCCPDPTAIYGP